MNPLRLEFITKHIKAHFQRDTLKDLHILDVGCGGGLLSEPLCRLGAKVIGLDTSPEAIDVAKDHAKAHDLSIHYEVGDLETLKESSHRPSKGFDVIIASEIIEHVDQPEVFIQNLSDLLKEGGCVFITTLNRTWKSFVLGIFVAENILKWAPKGAHAYDKFIKPSELHHFMEKAGLTLEKLQGLSFHPLKWQWELSQDFDVNYFAFGVKGNHV